MSEDRRGFLLGASAYLVWGFFPLYWPLLEPAGAVEILAQRIVWSLLTVLVVLALVRAFPAVRALAADRRRLALVAVAGVLICLNWGTYIYGVNSGQVVETSLGYFINPLVTILMGVLLLGERLRPVQWVALALALVAVVELTLDYGRLPLIALTLAFSFGSYGLLKKRIDAPALPGLGVETAVLAPFALAFLVVLQVDGSGTFGREGATQALLLAGTGVLTAVPLLAFGAAATRVSLTTLGLLQYVTPTLQFLIGVTVYDETMSSSRWLGFVLVWVALVIITTDAVLHRRRFLRRAAEASAV